LIFSLHKLSSVLFIENKIFFLPINNNSIKIKYGVFVGVFDELILNYKSEQEKMNFLKYLSEYSTSNRNRIDKELINTFSYYFCL
jgi:hypothetical protein